VAGEIVNLRRVRKAKARLETGDKAAENRRRHGLTKAEKQAEALKREQAERHIDGHRRAPSDD
jgi:hypothetical protein